MKIISDEQFAIFLSSNFLYTKLCAVEDFTIGENNYSNHLDFENKAFKFKCPYENEIHTFRTKLWGSNGMYYRSSNKDFSDTELPPFFNSNTKKLDLTIYLKGVCQSCQQDIHFLIKATSNKTWQERKSGISIYIQKIGQHPSCDIEPEPIILKYLTSEDIDNYKKALTCLSVNFGIGAYAYFRRVIENEIKRIIKDIAELDFDGVEKVKQAYSDFENDHQMANLITVVNKFLPTSMNQLGDNPIRLLYEQLSSGIHEFNDEVCIEKAKQVDILLRYVIKTLNEEKYNFDNIRNAMKQLRNNGR